MAQVDGQTRALAIIYRCLLIFLLLIVAILICGTVYGLFFRGTPSRQAPQPVSAQGAVQSAAQTFTGIGRVRVPTAGPQPGMAVIFVSFVYNPDDKVFTEELVLKIKDFRDIIAGYIGSFTLEDLLVYEEEELKRELLRRFNAVLRLGKIEVLYFSEFMVI